MEFRPQQIVKVNSFLWNFVYLGNKREAFLVSIWYRCIPVEHFLIKQTKDWYKIDFVKFGFLQSHFFGEMHLSAPKLQKIRPWKRFWKAGGKTGISVKQTVSYVFYKMNCLFGEFSLFSSKMVLLWAAGRFSTFCLSEHLQAAAEQLFF